MLNKPPECFYWCLTLETFETAQSVGNYAGIIATLQYLRAADFAFVLNEASARLNVNYYSDRCINRIHRLKINDRGHKFYSATTMASSNRYQLRY